MTAKNNTPEKKTNLNQCLAAVLLALSLFIFISLISYNSNDISFNTSHPNAQIKNFGGRVGAYFAWGLFISIGWAAYFLPFVIILWAVSEFFGMRPRKFLVKIFGIVVLFFALAAFFSSLGFTVPAVRYSAGGGIGLYFSQILLRYFGHAGSLIILFLIVALSLYICTDFLIMSFMFHSIASGIEQLKSLLRQKRENKKPAVLVRQGHSALPSNRNATLVKIKPPIIEETQAVKAHIAQIKEKIKPREIKITAEQPKQTKPKPQAAKQIGDYKLPTLDLLSAPPPVEERTITDDIENNSKILEETLRDFGIEVSVEEAERGPVITRYELQPAPGVKVNRIVSLSDDIALAMKAHSVRIIAPIPGKARVGVEVPNSATTMVYLQELLSCTDFQSNTSKLTLALGKDTAGTPLITDLSDMPHLLIAGTTGSGKTVCVNTIIMSMLYNATPDEVKFLMIDPKMVELAVYNGLPHLVCPVVTDARKAAGALNWVVNQMEERYKVLAHLGVRNIDLYNEKIKTHKDDTLERLPYIVVVIDELADLMVISAKEVEETIMRLAQLARAVGIHIILATQRPSVDVVTGVIKANFPARISFKVASKVDSRTVLDMNGADKLLGKGDMLFLPPGTAKPIRAQGSLVSDKEIECVVNFIKSQQEAIYNEEVLKQQERSFSYKGQEKDELFDQAVKLILESGQASVSILQRRMRLGYTRAARLIDMMEEEGIIGGYRGSKPREILIDSWEGTVARPQPEVQDVKEAVEPEELES